MTDREDRITYGTDAHVADPNENPLDHVGDVIPDPWDDTDQTDWNTGKIDLVVF